MLKKIFAVVITLFSTFGFTNVIYANETINPVYEARFGGATIETRTLTYSREHRMNNEVDGQPVYGTWLGKGGTLVVSPEGGREFNISVGYGVVGVDLGYLRGTIGSGVGGYVLPPVPTSGRYKVINKSLYRVTKYVIQRRLKGTSKWNVSFTRNDKVLLEQKFEFVRK